VRSPTLSTFGMCGSEGLGNLSGHGRVVLAIKVFYRAGANLKGRSRPHIREGIEASSRCLQADYIHPYQDFQAWI